MFTLFTVTTSLRWLHSSKYKTETKEAHLPSGSTTMGRSLFLFGTNMLQLNNISGVEDNISNCQRQFDSPSKLIQTSTRFHTNQVHVSRLLVSLQRTRTNLSEVLLELSINTFRSFVSNNYTTCHSGIQASINCQWSLWAFKSSKMRGLEWQLRGTSQA